VLFNILAGKAMPTKLKFGVPNFSFYGIELSKKEEKLVGYQQIL